MAPKALVFMDAAQFIDRQLRDGESFIMTCAPSGCKTSGLLDALCQQVAQHCQPTPITCKPVLVVRVPNDRTASEYGTLVNHNGYGTVKGIAHALTTYNESDWDRQIGALQQGCNILIGTSEALQKAYAEHHASFNEVRWLLVDGASQILKGSRETTPSTAVTQGYKFGSVWLDLSRQIPPKGLITVLVDHHWTQATWDRAHAITNNGPNISLYLRTAAHKCKTTVSTVIHRGLVPSLIKIMGRETTSGNWCLIFVSTVPAMHRLKTLINRRTDLSYTAEVIHPAYPGDPCNDALNKLFHDNVEVLIACHALALPQINSIERVILADLPLDSNNNLDIDELSARINWGRVLEHGGTGFWFPDTRILVSAKRMRQISALRTLLKLSHADEAEVVNDGSPEGGLPLASPNVVLSYSSSRGSNTVTEPLTDEIVDRIAGLKPPVQTSQAGNNEGS